MKLQPHRISYRSWLLVALVAVVYRFFAGRVLFRTPGRWDARWLSWAPPAPDHVAPREAPRTTWARRPGWQRQAVRLAAVAAVAGWWYARGLTVALVALVLAGAIARGALAAHRAHKWGPMVATWWPYVAAKVGADPAAVWRHVHLRLSEVRWQPVAPLAALVRPATPALPDDVEVGPPARPDPGGRLTRWAPWLARLLRPLATPISERARVLRWRTRWAADPRPRAAVAAAVLAWVIRSTERSRMVRAVPRVVRHDLGADDARVEIAYPATYGGHPQDVAEIQRVLRDRLPARSADADTPPDDDDAEDDDTVAALPAGAWTVRNDSRHLRLICTRAKVMPTAVTFDAARFAGYPLQEVPIGVEVTRSGRARIVVIPLKAKTPHVSIAASTGWGKTTTAVVVLAHLLYHGAHAVFLDPKEIGFVDAFRNAGPHAELWTTVDGWVMVIERVLLEMNRRYKLMNECADRVAALGLPKMHEFPELYFQPLILTEDEKGSLTTAIDEWWKRGDGSDDGKKGTGTPPPLSWQQQILWRGRAAAVHVITLAQQNNARVFLNTDMRDQYMFRILAGPQTAESWKMTFPGVRKRSIPRKKGRAYYGVGPEGIREVQLARIPDNEARACALHGVEVAQRENQARAEMLAQATGRPVWEVSPLPYWMPPPAQTVSAVPGQGVAGDSAGPADDNVFNLFTGTDPDPSAARSVDSDGDAAEGVSGTAENVPAAAAGGTPDTPADDADRIVGVAAAAAFLGISEDAFKQRRKRAARGEAPPIRGEHRIGKSPAWPPVELREWDNLFRSAG